MRKLRVCYTLNTFDLGGAETVALDLARFHDRGAFEVEVVSLIEPQRDGESAMRRRFREAGVVTHALVQPSFRSPMAIGRILAYLRRGRFDIVHGHSRGADYWGARLGAWAGIRGRSWTRHLVYQDMSPRQCARYRGLAARGARVIAVSQAVRQACESTEGLAPDAVETVVNGIDLTRFRRLDPEEKRAVRERCGVPPGAKMLLFVGRFSEQKAPDAFAHLVELLRRDDADVRGFMCGYGPLEDTLSGLAARSNGGLTVMGLRDDVPALLGACDLFVSTSRNEGLPLNVMEAMACGTPFVAPAIPQIAELAGVSGVLANQLMSPPPPTGEVPPATLADWAAVARDTLAEPARQRAVGDEAQAAIVREYSVDRMVGRYEDFFRRLVGVA